MRRNGGGQIITITTTLAQQPVAGVTAGLTSLTKGGLNSITRRLAIEYAAEGIRVNAIAPGIVDTPMNQPENHEFLKHLHPIPRLATVQEIVDAALFLARASFITGEVLYVDGGAHAGKWQALTRSDKGDSSMPFEMTVGLYVSDHDRYAQYRREIAPLLEAAEGRFLDDFEVARTLKSAAGHDINRLFVIQFPHRASKERFFADPQYLEIRARLFDKAAERRVTIAECGS